MKSLLICLKILVILPSNWAFAGDCQEKKELLYEEKSITLCYEKKKELYLSERCKDIKKSFLTKDINFKIYPNQSPGFSLCYQLGGEAFFGSIKGHETKIPMCKSGEHFIDQENLLGIYIKSKKK